MTEQEIRELGYAYPCLLPTGEWAGVIRVWSRPVSSTTLVPRTSTDDLVVGIDDCSWRTRYCYERQSDAIVALDRWDGLGDPPGPWLCEKPSGRIGPGAK